MSAGEQWRTIDCAPSYEVSDLGNVRRVGQEGSKALNLNPRTNYMQTTICVAGKTIVKPIHRLVGEAFLGPRPAGLETRHLNGDHYDNRACNLAYGTHSQNMLDQVAHGSHAMARRSHCPSGHEYSPENTTGRERRRRCRTCERARAAIRNAAVREKRIAEGWDRCKHADG